MDKLEIVNRALGKLGLPRAASLDDCDWNAQEVYENMVQEALRSYPWNFAQKYVCLSEPAPSPIFGYSYAYKLPDDCLRVLDARINKDLRAPIMRHSIVQGGYLYMNGNPCYLRYIQDIQDPALWAPDFCDVAACRIAAEIAALSAQKAELVPSLMQSYVLACEQAQTVDGRETKERIPLDNSIWAARQTNKG